MTTIREQLTSLRVLDLITNEEIVDDMISYFNRQDDKDQIREAIKTRYGLGVRTVQDPNVDGAAPQETYVRGKFETEVDAGIIEALAAGFGPRVVNALATMFTEVGKGFSLTSDETDDISEAEQMLQQYREAGSLSSELVKTDRRSVQVGSAGILTQWAGDILTYQVVSPSDVRAYFGDTITETNGEVETTRAVDRRDIEDASIVTIRLSQADETLWNYLAIFGRQADYPYGRWVTYQATPDSTYVPEVGDPDTFDYTTETGEIANPLSYWAEQNPDQNIPEYPIAIFQGGTTEENSYMPTYTSLYTDCKEMDVAASHLQATSQDAARGTTVLNIDEIGAGQPLPRTLHGAIVANKGQTVEYVDHKAQNSKDAMDVLERLMINLASGYSVPDYMISPDDSAISKESGTALMVKTQPLKKARQFRIELNAGAVKKLFEIERALIAMHAPATEDQTLIDQLQTARQQWDPGEITIPESKKDKTERLEKAKAIGVVDEIAAIREYYDLATDAEAIAVYEKMKERAEEYPALVNGQQAAPRRVGLPGRSPAINANGNA